MDKIDTPTFGSRKTDKSPTLTNMTRSKFIQRRNKEDFFDTFTKIKIHKHQSKSKTSTPKKEKHKHHKHSKINLVSEQFVLRNDFDSSHVKKFLKDKFKCLEPIILSDEIPNSH